MCRHDCDRVGSTKSAAVVMPAIAPAAKCQGGPSARYAPSAAPALAPMIGKAFARLR